MAELKTKDLEIMRKVSVFCSSTTGMDRVKSNNNFKNNFA